MQARDNGTWAGIGYNVYIRLDGSRIERGRMLDAVGAHTVGRNSVSVGVCVEGNYETVHRTMPDAQFNALVWTLRHLRETFGNNIRIRGHNEHTATACPGRFFPMAEVRRLEYRGQESFPVGEDITPALFEVTTQVSPLNVRVSPNTSASIRGTLPRGTMVTAKRRSGNWLYVTYGALTGWASADFLTEVVDRFPFADVRPSNWFYAAVRNMWERGIVTGTSATTFAPNEKLTRAAAVSLLYRLAGLPDIAIEQKFKDVRLGRWYYDAVAWARDLRIVQGVGGGKFAPEREITRQELAVMFYRYAGAIGDNTAVPADFVLAFPDAKKVSDWAVHMMRWAVYRGLIRGNDRGELTARGSATRAEGVAVLERFSNLSAS